MKVTVGEAIIKFLDAQYTAWYDPYTGDVKETKLCEYFYTVFGHGCVLGIGEALADTKHNLKVMQGKNEQGMALAAMSYAKQNNRHKILPCVSSIGPGSANMLTAAACSTANCIPLLLFLGDTYATRRPDPVLQQVEQTYNGGITTNDAFKAVTKYWDRVTRAEQLESILLNAVRVLTDTADTGAVAIAMPQDVQGEVYDFPKYLFEKRVIFAPFTMECASKFYPEYSALLKLSKEITAANSKPIFIVGGGARYSGAGKIIAELAEKYGIAVCETQAGKSVVESSFKYNLGGLGVTGNAAANTVAKDANLIIAVGTRFTDFTTASKTLFSKNAKIVTINTSRFHAEKLNASAIIGDAARILQILSATIKGNIKSEKRAEWIRIIEIAKREWELEYDRLSKVEYGENFKPEVGAYTPNVFTEFEKATGGATAQTAALALVRALIAPDAIAVAAAGSLPGDMQRMWKTDVRDTYNMEYGYSTMGYEIAGAFGSKLAAPDRDVYAFCGDGSYLMLHSELVTSIQEGKKITVLLFDNGGFGCINNLQMVKGCNSLATEFRYKAEAETPFVPIDFAASAAGYGVKTYSAHNLAELKTAIEDAKLQTKSCLIDIKVFPKTMTDGYGGFWQTGLNQSPRNDTQKAALAEQNRLIK